MKRSEVARDGLGRPLVIPVDGGKPVAYRRCTTFIDVLSDQYQLNQWKQRQTVVGLAKRPDLVLKAATAGGDRNALNAVAEAAMEAAGSSSSATIGTALHQLTESVDRGEAVVIPETARADIEAYRAATAAWAMQDIEVFVVNDDLRVAGTFDRAMAYPSEGGAVRFIADLKTGSIDFSASKIAMQLAMYANSERYNPETGERSPLNVSREFGYVIHLPAGRGACSLRVADLRAGWDGVLLAANVWGWRQRRGLLS